MLHYFAGCVSGRVHGLHRVVAAGGFAGFRVAEVPTRIRKRSAGQPSTRSVRLVLNYLRLLVVIVSHLSRPWRDREVHA